MTTQMTMGEFCVKHGIKFRYTEVTPSMRRQKLYNHVGARHFRCQARRKGYGVGATFSMGSALENDPTLEEFMSCISLEAKCADGVSFKDYCDEFGGDNDSIKTYRVYLACKKMAEKLKVLVGQAAYTELLQIEQE